MAAATNKPNVNVKSGHQEPTGSADRKLEDPARRAQPRTSPWVLPDSRPSVCLGVRPLGSPRTLTRTIPGSPPRARLGWVGDQKRRRFRACTPARRTPRPPPSLPTAQTATRSSRSSTPQTPLRLTGIPPQGPGVMTITVVLAKVPRVPHQ
ncbi:hypothetical protein C7M84_010456 [Penaeus vannamei]|uniref:Uncharacterized protein n=1 Tax=Penaeus vannamei TaxID=6689 RepID=A0A3R7M3X9_PENVA|nr:hypothetical protein C7M84_010456 [Penaeus vannamei]